MREKKGVKLKEALDWMALSPHLLWWYQDSWIDKARLGTGCCVSFQALTEEFRMPEESTFFEKPPSLEELGLVEAVPSSLEKPPSLEDTTSHDLSPSFEETQSLDDSHLRKEPSGMTNKKRRFSETELETCRCSLCRGWGGFLRATRWHLLIVGCSERRSTNKLSHDYHLRGRHHLLGHFMIGARAPCVLRNVWIGRCMLPRIFHMRSLMHGGELRGLVLPIEKTHTC